jgi:hypothetical protein
MTRLRTLAIAGAAGLALAFFLDPKSGEGRRDRFGKSVRDFMRRGRKQVNTTSRTLRRVAS